MQLSIPFILKKTGMVLTGSIWNANESNWCNDYFQFTVWMVMFIRHYWGL